MEGLDQPEADDLPAEARELLRSIAWAAVRAAANGQPAPVVPALPPSCQRLGAAFVTLHGPGGVLRGCIGSVQFDQPLVRVLQHVARQAATADPRFPAVEPGELDQLELEVSVLSPARPITGPSDIVVGHDGLIVEEGRRRGLLLPQVASERGWTAEQFLAATCRKAGLDEGAWRQPTTNLSAFAATVF